MSAMEMTEGFFDLMRKSKNNKEFMERLPVWEKLLH
jgi:transcription termination factor Rho